MTVRASWDDLMQQMLSAARQAAGPTFEEMKGFAQKGAADLLSCAAHIEEDFAAGRLSPGAANALWQMQKTTHKPTY